MAEIQAADQTSMLGVAAIRHALLQWDSGTAAVTELIAAEAGKQVVVLSYAVGQGPGANGAPLVLFKSLGTDLTNATTMSAFGFPMKESASRGVLLTAVGENLRIATLGSGVIHLTYKVI
jgi:hypothetical protein